MKFNTSEEVSVRIKEACNSRGGGHTRATIWVNQGLNIFAVANVLGHSDLKMLMERYAHKDVESTRELLGIK